MNLGGLSGSPPLIRKGEKMEKYDFIRCMNLHKKLKERIKGGIFISVENGKLSININAGRGIRYRSYIEKLPEREDIQTYADSIERDYRAFINEKYFI